MTNIQEKLIEIVKNQGVISVKNLTSESNFIKDLGYDSLDMTELQMLIEQNFSINISDQDSHKFITIGEATKYLSQVLVAA
ncbi:phosphopantetheine-binding protein [Emticicia sp.]|uniref:phosphopantetheine-binding protein n=1 Tax=Emticicia sp. TaxID=1930953 RepID=UPI003750953B